MSVVVHLSPIVVEAFVVIALVLRIMIMDLMEVAPSLRLAFVAGCGVPVCGLFQSDARGPLFSLSILAGCATIILAGLTPPLSGGSGPDWLYSWAHRIPGSRSG